MTFTMKDPLNTQRLVAGLGSPHGDDQLGWLVIDELLRSRIPGVAVRKLATPHELLDHLQDVAELIVCDAAAGGTVGQISRYIWPDLPEALGPRTSSHHSGLRITLELARFLFPNLGSPQVWTITGTCWEKLANATPAALIAVPILAEEIRHALASGPLDEA